MLHILGCSDVIESILNVSYVVSNVSYCDIYIYADDLGKTFRATWD